MYKKRRRRYKKTSLDLIPENHKVFLLSLSEQELREKEKNILKTLEKVSALDRKICQISVEKEDKDESIKIAANLERERAMKHWVKANPEPERNEVAIFFNLFNDQEKYNEKNKEWWKNYKSHPIVKKIENEAQKKAERISEKYKDKISEIIIEQFSLFQSLVPFKIEQPKRYKESKEIFTEDPFYYLVQKDWIDLNERAIRSDKYQHLYSKMKRFRKIDELLWVFRNIVKSLPAIRNEVKKLKVKKKKKERSATLAAYEKKSRNVGQTLMKRMREEVSLPFYCNYCSQKTLKKDIHIDHINPVSNGGLSVERNLIPICKTCNLEKKDLSLRKFSKSKGLDYEEICDRLENQDKFV